jgi:O-antigen/teichoic acid export membrane protein
MKHHHDHNILNTTLNLTCSYAKFQAIIGIIISIVICIVCIGFAYASFTNKMTTVDQKTGEEKHVPEWFGFIFLTIGVLLIVGSVFYYKFLNKHHEMCRTIGSLSAIRSLTGGLRRRRGIL